MQLGMIGLGRMGGEMVRRLMRGGRTCVVFDSKQENVTALAAEGAAGARSLRDFVEALETPRAIWLMLPAAAVEGTLTALSELLQPGDVVIDGGNAHYVDDIHRARALQARPRDAETSPMRDPDRFQYTLALPEIAELWRRGSVIGSWLLDLTARALAEHPDLQPFSGRVSDSGEGRWTALAAIESSAPAPVLTAALFQRFSSRGEDDFSNRLLSALRLQFGGHHESPGER
jgi:6-phosphogluconate dehydrogenase (decarboxylating)